MAEAGEMPVLGLPLDPHHVLGRIRAAAGDLIALTVLGSLERPGRASIACSNASERPSSMP
jgi:hypothetical protein